MYFIHTVHVLRPKNGLISIPLTFCAVVGWGCGLAISGLVLHDKSLENPNIEKVAIAQKTLSIIVELLVAVIMCIYFGNMHTGMKSTDSMIHRLTVFAASRGLIICGIQIVYTAVYFSNPNQLFWVPFHFMLAKFCVNSVIASLNIRDHMRGKDNIVSSNVFMSMGTFISRSRDNQRDQDTTNQSTGTNDMPGKSELTLTAVEGGVQIERVKFVSSV
ncbi:hypothetical protein D9757_011571 [Collybiopsis confluens]|uniref:DUF6534 domain-containing protein n=2 Tax=Collybiopsis confluens TaxID=2823264 RepID=A0A8H5GNT2_9AGAR|nr:hypothetical protein D9757_011571 [Collybiopsis confluens]